MRQARSRVDSAGFTFIEVMVTLGIVTLILSAVFPLLGTSTKLSEAARLRMRVESEQRRNLLAVSRALQGIDLTTLVNVDPSTGTTDQPAFARVTGVEEGVRAVGDEETISWIPVAADVPGVSEPGNLWLLRGATKTLLAARVPKDGFHVTQVGRTLRITLTTYYPMAARFETVTSSTAVAVRN